MSDKERFFPSYGDVSITLTGLYQGVCLFEGTASDGSVVSINVESYLVDGFISTKRSYQIRTFINEACGADVVPKEGGMEIHYGFREMKTGPCIDKCIATCIGDKKDEL